MFATSVTSNTRALPPSPPEPLVAIFVPFIANIVAGE